MDIFGYFNNKDIIFNYCYSNCKFVDQDYIYN